MIGALSFWTEVHNTESEIEDSVLESTDWPSQKLKINQLIINIREWIQWIKDADYIPQINQSLQTHQTATPNGLLDSTAKKVFVHEETKIFFKQDLKNAQSLFCPTRNKSQTKGWIFQTNFTIIPAS